MDTLKIVLHNLVMGLSPNLGIASDPDPESSSADGLIKPIEATWDTRDVIKLIKQIQDRHQQEITRISRKHLAELSARDEIHRSSEQSLWEGIQQSFAINIIPK
jgi:hypothetical protein